MAKVEVSRTLVKSPPELWSELEGTRLSEAMGNATVRPTEFERRLSWETPGARGTAVLEPSAWGTKVTLTAEVEEGVARHGVWGRLRGRPTPAPMPAPSSGPGLERRLEALLDDLGAAHRKPYTRE